MNCYRVVRFVRSKRQLTDLCRAERTPAGLDEESVCERGEAI